jgi:hypothetical protein
MKKKRVGLLVSTSPFSKFRKTPLAKKMSSELPPSTQSTSGQAPIQFSDRRNAGAGRKSPGLERRQFSDSHDSLSADAAELGRAIDQYKLANRRRYASYEELLSIIKSLGYSKTPQ